MNPSLELHWGLWYNIIIILRKGRDYLTGKEWSKFLYDNGVYDAYQFISNSRKTIGVALYCKEMILALISQMGEGHQRWQADLFGQLFDQSSPIKKVAVTEANMPSYELSICNVETTIPFLLDKLTKDFFQYIRNSFDCMSQAVNAACLASRSKNIERVDFSFMKRVFDQQTYSQAFPRITGWYDRIANSNEFLYIEAFNNRTKHICDVYLKLSMAIIGGGDEASINPFFKKETQHTKQDVTDYLSAVYIFASDAYSELLTSLKAEIPRKLFVNHRVHKINIYQQKIVGDSNGGYSMAYIDAFDDISNMPDEIEVLFLREYDGEIIAKNCPINTLYIKDPQDDLKYIGTYVATDICGDDILLKYRKYRKIPYTEGMLPLCYQAMNDPESKEVFYHGNPFMNIRTVSDDEVF